MKSLTITLFALLLAVGCSQRPDYIVIESKSDSCKVLNLDPVFEPIPWNTTTISDVVDTIKIVPLETTPESILAGVFPLRIYGDRVVIHDMNEDIAIFDISGKFIRRIRRGQGPGEINYVADFDADNQYLYVMQTEKISKFTLDGEFVEYYSMPEKYMFCLEKMKKVDDGYLLSKHPYSDDTPYEVFHLDEKLNERSHFMFEQTLRFCGQSGFMMMDGKLVFYMPMCNTIYQFDGKTFSPYLVFNYPKFANTFENYSGLNDPREFFQKYCTFGKYFFSGNIYQASNILYISFWDVLGTGRNVYLDTQSGKFRVCARASERDNPYEYLLYWGGVSCSYNDCIVRNISPEHYLTEPKIPEVFREREREIMEEHGFDWKNAKKEERDKDWYSKLEHISPEDVLKLKTAKPEDNPILIFVKFKNITE